MAGLCRWNARLLGLLAGLVGATPALAQSAAAPPSSQLANSALAAAQASSNVHATPPQNTGPGFSLLGVPVRLSAPVPPPYAATSYNDLGGQPMNSVDEAMAQQFTGQQQ